MKFGLCAQNCKQATIQTSLESQCGRSQWDTEICRAPSWNPSKNYVLWTRALSHQYFWPECVYLAFSLLNTSSHIWDCNISIQFTQCENYSNLSIMLVLILSWIIGANLNNCQAVSIKNIILHLLSVFYCGGKKWLRCTVQLQSPTALKTCDIVHTVRYFFNAFKGYEYDIHRRGSTCIFIEHLPSTPRIYFSSSTKWLVQRGLERKLCERALKISKLCAGKLSLFRFRK